MTYVTHPRRRALSRAVRTIALILALTAVALAWLEFAGRSAGTGRAGDPRARAAAVLMNTEPTADRGQVTESHVAAH